MTSRVGPIQPAVMNWDRWNRAPFALTAIALTLVLRLRWSPLRTLGLCVAPGLAILALPAR